MDLLSLVRSLSETPGVSGYETVVCDVVREAFAPYVQSQRCDAMGNLIALRQGMGEAPRPSIMLAGHMDEIGLIVTKVDKGFLRFTQIGGFDVRTLPGQQVVVHGRRDLPGIIGCRPPHVVPEEERRKVMPMDDLFVDVGLGESDLAGLVRAGDIVSIRASLTELSGGRCAGKAMDDRASVAAIAVCLEALSGMRHAWDVYAVATVQEEMGLRGATTATFGVVPDVGIAIDVGFGRQPGVGEEHAIDVNQGPALTIGPNIHPALFRALKEVAEEHEVPVQTTFATRGTGTDANAMQITCDGIPTALLSIPLRNMHTPIETLALKDIARTGRLLALFIASLTPAFVETLAWDDAAENGGRP